MLGLPLIVYGFVLLRTTKFRLIHHEDLSAFGGRAILYSWHQNIFLTLLLAKHVVSCKKSIGLTNDRLASLLMTLPATVFGYRMFVFTLKNHQNRVEQVSECFQHGNPLILMADGGGPYFKIKPGLVKTAVHAQAKLIPVAFHLKGGLELGKIRKHRWPLPFSRIDCLIGKPMDVDASNIENSLSLYERSLAVTEARLKEHAVAII